MNRPPLLKNHIYHIYNRGVDGRKIFIDEDDYFRFIHDLFEFNDTAPAIAFNYKFSEIRSQKIDGRKPRKLLAHLLTFSLMPNHFHLLLEQKEENGISDFLRKLGVGYAMYFNHKYKRSGALFQGRFKAVLIKDEAHFIHLPYYIHANPLDLKAPRWRSGEIDNREEAMEFLENYRWSSFLDYTGKKNFPSVTQRDLLLNISGGESEYKKHFIDWLRHMDIKIFDNLTLEK